MVKRSRRVLVQPRKSSRFLPLGRETFHPMAPEDIERMIHQIKFGFDQASDPRLRPTDGQIYDAMKKHADEEHKDIDAAVRERLNVKLGATLTPGNIHRYKELYESEMRDRERRRKKP